MQKFDYIISGAGIAGVTLAHHLLFKNKKILLFDSGVNHSSRVAAGLYNPITGRKMVKTWNADLLFPYLLQFYKQIENLVAADFIHETTIYRPFYSVEEQNDWLGKSSEESYKDYIKSISTKSLYPEKFHDPYGGLFLNYSGWLNISQYLDSSMRYFEQDSRVEVVKDNFIPSKITFADNEVAYEKYSAGKIIFCEGIELKNNHFFNWLPLQLLKGEILEIELPFLSEVIFNRGIFILPIKEKCYKIGSTYTHHDTSLEITQEGRQQLESKLRALVKTDYEVIHQSVGIRPTTKDRRPFVGAHPDNDKLLVFNGLGTKGVSIAPFLAYNLINHLEKQENLLDEVNIKRFLSLY